MLTFHRPRHFGFTVIELLVVISIIAVIMGISFPFISKMVESTNLSVAKATVSVAASGARAYATKNYSFLDDLDPNTPGTQNGETLGDGYSGAAALFTNAGEIRLILDLENAVDQSGNIMEIFLDGGNGPRNGYADLENFDYIKLPSNIGVLGLLRTPGGPAELKLIPPPFAIAFDRNGVLTLRQNKVGIQRAEGWIYYDANGNGKFDTSSDRASILDPPSDYSRENADRLNDGTRELPFEKIESVIGVIVYQKSQSPYTEPDFIGLTDNGSPSTTVQWLYDNGEVIFFSRYTGARSTN